MNGDSFLVHGDVGTAQVHPGAGVVILHTVTFQLHGNVGVSTENALSSASFCIAERALPDLRRKAQPSCVETVKVTGKPFVFGINLLQPQIDELPDPAEKDVVADKA